MVIVFYKSIIRTWGLISLSGCIHGGKGKELLRLEFILECKIIVTKMNIR